jgi:hypothetical protein
LRKSSIKNQQTLLLVACAALIISLFNISNILNQKIYAHIFTTDETASFLSFADQLQVESELVQTNLVNNNLSLAQKHANKAASLLTPSIIVEIAERNQRIANDLVNAVNNLQNISSSQQQVQQPVSTLVSDIDAILSEALITRIDQDQRDNATIRALAFANLVDSILTNYGNAFAVEFDMTNMSNMQSMMNMDMDGNNTGMGSMSEMSSEMNRNYSLVNAIDYQSAQALASKSLEIFNAELKSMASNNTTAFITNLENGLTRLIDSIRSKASPMDIMMIFHTQIHPNLLDAFNLKLR